MGGAAIGMSGSDPGMCQTSYDAQDSPYNNELSGPQCDGAKAKKPCAGPALLGRVAASDR